MHETCTVLANAVVAMDCTADMSQMRDKLATDTLELTVVMLDAKQR